MYKLGSLFDGSGGFPLAGSLCGVEPCWASEVEPYPIAVTRTRFPRMKHLGDISKINGGEVEPVDIITFGSPCQDLSVAGKQAGIKHADNGDEETTRSGLFMEAVRIIKEMREATNGRYPTFALWENVPGAFSSNKGEDFRIVLEELVKIVEPSASMPAVPSSGWPYADSYIGDGWSLAYRVFDAQYWGVPQRRRRIHLVLDLRDERAREVLFEREGVRGYFTAGGTPGQGAPADAQRSAGADDREGEGFDGYNGDLTGDKSATLGVNCGQSTGRNGVIVHGGSCGRGLAAVTDRHLFENHGQDSRYKGPLDVCPMLPAQLGTGGNNQPLVMEPFCKSARARSADDATARKHATVANTLNTFDQEEARANDLVVQDAPVYCLQGNGIDRADTAGCNGRGWREDASYTLNTMDRPAVVYAMDRAAFNQGQNVQYNPEITDSGVKSTLVAKGPSAVAYECTYQKTTGPLMANSHPGSYSGQDAYQDMFVVGSTPPPISYIVRRLTPTECARLQGFADRWGDIEPKTDFTEDELRFWLEVRNTHAAINGKPVKEYTKKQMLTWYSKLQTDSAKYKMWGNGIALPPALYVLQGMVDVLEMSRIYDEATLASYTEDDLDWLD